MSAVVLLRISLCNARVLLYKLKREIEKSFLIGQMSRPSSSMIDFRASLAKSKNIVIMTGAGVSAESGIPTFRGAGGMWRKFQAASLASPEAFESNPSLVWEFYHYRRETAANAAPNACHTAIAGYQAKHSEDKSVTVITQNVDGLHIRAGNTGVIELHGNLFKTRCTKCNEVLDNNDSPICEVLTERGTPDANFTASDIPIEQLPHCKKDGCGGLLRPHIVWFGESLNSAVLEQTQDIMDRCDVCIVVGTSAVVYPAAMFAPAASARGAIVAEFNIERTANTHEFNYYFEGPCGTTVPEALS